MGLGYYGTIGLSVYVWDDRATITLDSVSLGLLWCNVLGFWDVLVIERVDVLLCVEVDRGEECGSGVYCDDNYCVRAGVCVVLVTGSTVT